MEVVAMLERICRKVVDKNRDAYGMELVLSRADEIDRRRKDFANSLARDGGRAKPNIQDWKQAYGESERIRSEVDADFSPKIARELDARFKNSSQGRLLSAFYAVKSLLDGQPREEVTLFQKVKPLG